MAPNGYSFLINFIVEDPTVTVRLFLGGGVGVGGLFVAIRHIVFG